MDFKIKIPILKVTDEQLLVDLKKVANILKKDISSQSDHKKHGKYSISTYGDHFGNFREALKKAGLSISRNWGTSREDYLENLKEVCIKLGSFFHKRSYIFIKLNELCCRFFSNYCKIE